MGRTSIEHELVIDVLDDLLAFGYAYEGERTKNDHLVRLCALAEDVRCEMDKDTNAQLFLLPREKKNVIIGVMNRLQTAIRSGVLPEDVNFELEWANKPPALTRYFLETVQAEQADDLYRLMAATIDRLDTAFPSEARPFITREQVAACIHVILKNMPVSFTVPIHVDMLGELLHQEFLTSLKCGDPTRCDSMRWDNVFEIYTRRALDKLYEMVKNEFATRMVHRLILRAKELNISIDCFYSWGTLWMKTIDGIDLLDSYKKLNLSGVIVDGKFKRKNTDDSDSGVSEMEFIGWAREYFPQAHKPSRASGYQIYFNTDKDNISVSGKAIQKHAVMAIRYDEPLRDIEEKLKCFGNFLRTQRKRHLANEQESLSAEDHAMMQPIEDNAKDVRKAKRAVLHDKSSVLGHICTLIFLQMEYDSEYKEVSKKKKILTIYERIKESGFVFETESIRKACGNHSKVMDAVMQHLAKA